MGIKQSLTKSVSSILAIVVTTFLLNGCANKKIVSSSVENTTNSVTESSATITEPVTTVSPTTTDTTVEPVETTATTTVTTTKPVTATVPTTVVTTTKPLETTATTKAVTTKPVTTTAVTTTATTEPHIESEEIEPPEEPDTELKYIIKNNQVIITGCSGIEKEIIIPPEIEGYPVTAIGKMAFFNCLCETVQMPDSITLIEEAAFRSSDITHIDLSPNLTRIEAFAFTNCNLTSIDIPDSVTIIGEGAFDSCGRLNSIKLSDNLKFITDYMFADCINLTTIELPDSITAIGGSAFRNCQKLESINIPRDTTFLSTCLTSPAFEGCIALTDLTYKDKTYSYNNIDKFYKAMG